MKTYKLFISNFCSNSHSFFSSLGLYSFCHSSRGFVNSGFLNRGSFLDRSSFLNWCNFLNRGNFFNRGSFFNSLGSSRSSSCVLDGGLVVGWGMVVDRGMMVHRSRLVDRGSMVDRSRFVDRSSMIDRSRGVDRSNLDNRSSLNNRSSLVCRSRSRYIWLVFWVMSFSFILDISYISFRSRYIGHNLLSAIRKSNLISSSSIVTITLFMSIEVGAGIVIGDCVVVVVDRGEVRVGRLSSVCWRGCGGSEGCGKKEGREENL